MHTFFFKGFRVVRKRIQKAENYFKIKSKDEKKLKMTDKDLVIWNSIKQGKWEENIPCNYCGSYERSDYLFDNSAEWYGKPFKLVECLRCHLVYADPRPVFKSILDYYLDSEWSEEMRTKKFKRPNIGTFHQTILKKCQKYHGNVDSIFDIGTGAGTLLLEAGKMGIRVSGNEINRASCRWLNNNGVKVYNTPTNKLMLDDSFDTITVLDYIEHTFTPFDDLKWVSKHLNPNGILYLETLYLESPNHRMMGRKWDLFGQGHFHYYYTFVLSSMLHDIGLRIIRQELKDSVISLIARKER